MHQGCPSVLFGIAAAAVIAAATPVEARAADAPGSAGRQPVSVTRQQELARFLRHDCGSCHGLTLRGGLGPALTPEALAGKPPAYLKAMILDGRRGSAMPGWRPLLSEAEAAWMAENLLRGVPDAH
jgi:cytochrome c55X